MSITHLRLRAELLDRADRDQRARRAVDTEAMHDIDADNLAFLAPIIERHGWPHSAMVGDDGAHACWLVVQHSPPAHQDRWLPLLREAVNHGLADRCDLAYLEDRVDLHHRRPQTYGTQWFRTGSQRLRLWLLREPDAVDALRHGLGRPPLDADAIADAWTTEEIATLHTA